MRKQRIRLSLFALSTLILFAAVVGFGAHGARAATLAGSRASCLSDHLAAEDTISACTVALMRNPKNAKVLIQRGAAWIKMGDYDFAIGDFSRAIRLDSHSAMAFCQRGAAREKKGDLQASLVDFKRCSELDPTDIESQIAMDRILSALAPKPSLEEQNEIPALSFASSESALSERPAVVASTGPTVSAVSNIESSADSFALMLPTLFLVASIAIMAIVRRKGGPRTTDNAVLSPLRQTGQE